MILRKPYAFFIKYFKLLHAIIAVLIGLLLYRTFTLYNFFRSYVSDYSGAVNEFSPRTLINIYSFLGILLVVCLTIVLLSVMVYKKKPKLLYIYSLISYVLIAILFGVTFPILRDISVSILDVRVSKALRDFFMIAVFVQVISVVWYGVRATGFDIKQFDFASDLQKLDINEQDSEEIEVSLEFDKNKVNRSIRYNLRQLKYLYYENKFWFDTIGAILLVVIIFNIYLNMGVYTASYDQGSSFDASGVTMNIKNAYITNKDASGTALSDYLAVIKFDVKKTYSSTKTLNTGLMTLLIDGDSYSQNNDYALEMYDIGEAYNTQKLNSEFETYILAFVIPEDKINSSMTLKFNDNVSYVKGEVGAKNILVDLKMTNLLEESSTNSSKVGEIQDYGDSVLDEGSLKIDSYAIDDKFKISYNYCYGTNKCMVSYEYLTASATGSYFKTLLKIDGSFDIESNEISDIASFMNTFGTISYKVDGTLISKKLNTEKVKPQKGTTTSYFVEVPYEVKNASEIYFTFNIRNFTYKYVLK